MDSDDFAARLQDRLGTMTRTTRRVAQYFAQNPLEVVSRSAGDLGALLQTSDATVVRTAQALGYAGLAELKRALAATLATPSPVDGFRQTVRAADADARRAMTSSLLTQARLLNALLDQSGKDMLEAVALLLDKSRRIVMFGLGPTSHIVAYGAQLLRRHGRQVQQLHAGGRGLADDLLTLGEGDALLVFAYGSAYAEVSATMSEALTLGLPIILVTDTGKGPLVNQADLVAVVPRGETNGMATHGVTVIWIEALVTMLSVLNQQQADLSLAKLQRLRRMIDKTG